MTSEALDQVYYPKIVFAIVTLGGVAVGVNQWGTSVQIGALDTKVSSLEKTMDISIHRLLRWTSYDGGDLGVEGANLNACAPLIDTDRYPA